MIDTTDPAVMERALAWCQGKSLLNCVNLEDGRERFRPGRPARPALRRGAGRGLIDEDPQQGMAVTRERKLAIARRAHALLSGSTGCPRRTSSWTRSSSPAARGTRTTAGARAETIEGVRALKAAFPRTKTILGISNVSFGLPGRGREVLNTVFLYHAVLAGLDLAIVNTERLERYPAIPEAERRLAEDLLFDRGADPVGGVHRPLPRRASRGERPAARRPHARRAARGLHHRGHQGRAWRTWSGPSPAPVPGRPRRSSTAPSWRAWRRSAGSSTRTS